jgi:hypothetical protein
MNVLARTNRLTMKNSCEIDASQQGQEPLDMEAQEPLPGSVQ